mmetsp:Transcript_27870/g.79910  ORF Transcript_27870/g.79910 Transcript_27870/m.79910 type:complete len:206 (-) Transcript_27870:754-1371(-)
MVDEPHHRQPMAALRVDLLRRVAHLLHLFSLAPETGELDGLQMQVPEHCACQHLADHQQQGRHHENARADASDGRDTHAEAAALDVGFRKEHAPEECDRHQGTAHRDGVADALRCLIDVALQRPTICVLLAELGQEEETRVQADRHGDGDDRRRHVVRNRHDVHPWRGQRRGDDEGDDDEDHGQKQQAHVLHHAPDDQQGDRHGA